MTQSKASVKRESTFNLVSHDLETDKRLVELCNHFFGKTNIINKYTCIGLLHTLWKYLYQQKSPWGYLPSTIDAKALHNILLPSYRIRKKGLTILDALLKSGYLIQDKYGIRAAGWINMTGQAFIKNRAEMKPPDDKLSSQVCQVGDKLVTSCQTFPNEINNVTSQNKNNKNTNTDNALIPNGQIPDPLAAAWVEAVDQDQIQKPLDIEAEMLITDSDAIEHRVNEHSDEIMRLNNMRTAKEILDDVARSLTPIGDSNKQKDEHLIFNYEREVKKIDDKHWPSKDEFKVIEDSLSKVGITEIDRDENRAIRKTFYNVGMKAFNDKLELFISDNSIADKRINTLLNYMYDKKPLHKNEENAKISNSDVVNYDKDKLHADMFVKNRKQELQDVSEFVNKEIEATQDMRAASLEVIKRHKHKLEKSYYEKSKT